MRVARFVAGLVALGVVMVGLAVPASAQTPVLYSWGIFGSDGPVDSAVVTPTAISGIPGTIVQMTTSNTATYVLTSTGVVWAIGAGGEGALGNGGTTNSFSVPVQVDFPAGVTIASLPNQSPFDTAMAIDTTGRVWGWGENGQGELCLGSATNELKPVELPSILSGVTLVTGGGGHALYDASGTVYACGDNTAGELGNGNTTSTMTPTAVTGLPHLSVTSLVSSYKGSGALMSNGTYWDWGLNNLGQLGNGSTTNADVPAEVALPATVSQVGQGGSSKTNGQTLAVLSNGDVYGWGENDDAQLCSGAVSTPVLRPEEIAPPSGTDWASAASGGATSYLIDSSGGLWACGRDTAGQIGKGKEKPYKQKPKKVLSGVTEVSGTGSGNVAALVG